MSRRIITVKYSAPCRRCGKVIKEMERAYYYPSTRQLECLECAGYNLRYAVKQGLAIKVSAKCPKCGTVADHETAVRQGTAKVNGVDASLVDVGWRCVKCGFEFGFEMFKEES